MLIVKVFKIVDTSDLKKKTRSKMYVLYIWTN